MLQLIAHSSSRHPKYSLDSELLEAGASFTGVEGPADFFEAAAAAMVTAINTQPHK